jgi:hypothetical protein
MTYVVREYAGLRVTAHSFYTSLADPDCELGGVVGEILGFMGDFT